jgi:distribution and morphology protein 31
MSSHIKHRLWSQLWAPASPLASKSRPLRPSFNHATFQTSTRRAFSRSRPRAQSRPSPRSSVVKSFAPCGFLFFDINPGAAATPAVTSCVTTAEKSLYTTSSLHKRPVTSLAQQAWRREMHSSTRRRQRGIARRNKSSTSSSQNGRKPPGDGEPASSVPPKAQHVESTTKDASPTSQHYIHLPHMPKMPHRPTKEELLAAATGFWSRLKVRFKWFSIRSSRPWNIDDWSAFVSWFVLGNIAWIFIGTTTFFSLVILSINTVVAQGMSNTEDSGNTEINIPCRNIGEMGRRLSDSFSWHQGCFRVRHCTEMEGRGNHLS